MNAVQDYLEAIALLKKAATDFVEHRNPYKLGDLEAAAFKYAKAWEAWERFLDGLPPGNPGTPKTDT